MPHTAPAPAAPPGAALRRLGLLATVLVALALGAPEASARSAGWSWPLTGADPRTPAAVARRFDPPAAPWLPGHRGVDLVAEAGASVTTAGPGVVRFAGTLAGRGVVAVDHPGGLRTTYEPVEAAVAVGQVVPAGARLGALQPGGHCAPAACLHWGLRRGRTYLDPLLLVAAGPPRLLPLTGAPVSAGPPGSRLLRPLGAPARTPSGAGRR